MHKDSERKKAKGPAPWSREKALAHLAALCAKGEECEADLREKMRRHSLAGPEADGVIDYLYEHKFLDEERFARAYARDKLRFNGWGRLKITMMLRTKRVAGCHIADALAALDADEYRAMAARLVKSAARSLTLTDYNDRARLLARMYARGFEPALIRDIIDELTAAES